MTELETMIDKLKKRAELKLSVFTDWEVKFLLKILEQQAKQSDSKISLNSSLDNGGENNG